MIFEQRTKNVMNYTKFDSHLPLNIIERLHPSLLFNLENWDHMLAGKGIDNQCVIPWSQLNHSTH